jgi:hypothetical protein
MDLWGDSPLITNLRDFPVGKEEKGLLVHKPGSVVTGGGFGGGG